jgi:hypothetical protein
MDAVELLLQSGRKNPRVHRFYESCGFEPGAALPVSPSAEGL